MLLQKELARIIALYSSCICCFSLRLNTRNTLCLEARNVTVTTTCTAHRYRYTICRDRLHRLTGVDTLLGVGIRLVGTKQTRPGWRAPCLRTSDGWRTRRSGFIVSFPANLPPGHQQSAQIRLQPKCADSSTQFGLSPATALVREISGSAGELIGPGIWSLCTKLAVRVLPVQKALAVASIAAA